MPAKQAVSYGKTLPVLVHYSWPQQCFISRIGLMRYLKCSAKEWHASTHDCALPCPH